MMVSKEVITKTVEMAKQIKEFMTYFNKLKEMYERVNRKSERLVGVNEGLSAMQQLNAKIFAEECKLTANGIMPYAMMMNVKVNVGFMKYRKYALIVGEYYDAIDFMGDEFPNRFFGKLDVENMFP